MGTDFVEIPLEVRRRQFLLNLSLIDGQEIATSLGFQPASADVQKVEKQDVLKSIVQLSASGVSASLYEATDWFMDVLASRMDLDDSQRENTFNIFLAFAVSSTLKLISEDLTQPTTAVEVVVVEGDDES